MAEDGRKKVALLFGSFNPIHDGHLAILEYILANRPGCEVRLVVSPQNPFKEGRGLLDNARRRLEDARTVIADKGLDVKVSDVEFSMEPPLYTINTLRYLREAEPDKDFVLVIGGDNIASINRWHCGADILKEFEVWVYPRPGTDAQEYCDLFNSNPQNKGVTLFTDAELHNISSTEIREKMKEAKQTVGNSEQGPLRGNKYDVVIIGGGITGAGTARDCAMRGLKVLLVEKADITNGATGRNHGLLHSGARYAVGDPESATECIRENKILKKIAPHCVEENDGLFISLPEDDLEYQKRFVEACSRAGIEAQAMDPKEAIALESSVNRDIIGAVRVPDGSVDPFRLALSNIEDAKAHGAEVRTYTEVTGFVKDGDRVVGINLKNTMTGEQSRVEARISVNAAGIWGAHIAEMAGARISMYPAKGTLLVFGHRVNQMVLNRCRKSADGDILVPGETVTIIGTTSTRVPFEEIDDVRPTPDEVDLLIREGSKLAPALSNTRILRAYAGVRPLVASDDDPTGRGISRGIVLLDHETRDGISGFITITGGKLMTYRLMAERATDLVCSKLGISVSCTTATTELPKLYSPRQDKKTAFSSKGLICECEIVNEDQIRNAIDNLGANNLETLRRRTRLGMGTCQGQLCVKKAAELMKEPDIKGFMRERWKGIYPVAWGDALREAQLSQWIYNDEV